MTDKEARADGAGAGQTGDGQAPVSLSIPRKSTIAQFDYTNDNTPPALTFGELVRAVVVRGEPPTDGAGYGDYQQEADALLHGWKTQGREGALKVWGALTAHNPDLAGFEIDPDADPWQWRTMADAYAERPPLQYLVRGLFPLPSLSILYGAPGTLKSLLLNDLSVCVVGGFPWLAPMPNDQSGLLARETRQAAVAWCDFDNGTRRCDERFGALGRAYGLPVDAPLYYVSFPNPWLDASKPSFVDNMVFRVEKLGVRLVVIDNLGQVSGDADENSAEMTGVLSNIRQLVEATGIACVVIHHQRKNPAGTATRAGDNLRGHSSIEAAIDLALHIHRDPNAESIQIQSTKTRDVDVLPFGALFTFEHKPGTTELETARFFGLATEDTTSDRAVMDEILRVVGEQSGLNQRELKDAVKEALPDVGVNRIGQVANLLVTQGKLKARQGERRALHYDPA